MKQIIFILALALNSFANAQNSTPPAAPAKNAAASPAAAAGQATQSATGATGQNLPTEVVIKGTDSGKKLEVQKPPLRLQVDPYESIRKNLEPDPSLLLAVSPMTASWRKTYPDFLDNKRVIEPWLTTFGRKAGIVFHVQDQLQQALGKKISDNEMKQYAWSLTVADEDGRIFYRKAENSAPPSELVWSGENDQNEWIRAGHSYSAIYTFTDPNGAPYTVPGQPLLFHGIVHQEDNGLYVTLDSSILFGKTKSDGEIAMPAGLPLLRSAADLVKRSFTGIPITVKVFAATPDVGQTQGQAVQIYMQHELMMQPQSINVEAAPASFSEQRVEIVILNR